MRWTTINQGLYRLGHLAAAGRRPPAPLLAAVRRAACPPRPDGPVLYLAGGRLGDALLAAAFTARYRDWLGAVVAIGRPETEVVVAPFVDRFVAVDPVRPVPASVARDLALLADRGCRAVLGDLHLFHAPAFLQLGAAFGAPLLAYDGWIDRSRQAPFRRFPTGATIIPPLAKDAAPAAAESLHLFADLLHYHRQALPHLGARMVDLPTAPILPPRLRDPEAVAALRLPNGYVACHAQSSQPKKDWPLDRFAAVFAACPDVPFAVLGNDAAAPLPQRDNVVDLRARTNLAAAIAVAANARAFVGIDSGPAHAAALAGVPTVVVMAQATPGYFFPYPRAFGGHVATVRAEAYAACAGCGGICAHAPIWQSRRHGFPCLGAVAAEPVTAALRRALS